MPTPRDGSTAVHIPGCGDLVLGGIETSGSLRSAELMEETYVDGRRVHAWRQIDPMIKAKRHFSAVYFDRAVFVFTRGERTVEMLSLPNNQPGQWTLIFEKNPPSNCLYRSMCVFNGRILVACELEDIHLSYILGHFPNIFLHDLFIT